MATAKRKSGGKPSRTGDVERTAERLPAGWYRNAEGELCHDGECFSIRFGKQPVVEFDPECRTENGETTDLLALAVVKAIASGQPTIYQSRSKLQKSPRATPDAGGEGQD